LRLFNQLKGLEEVVVEFRVYDSTCTDTDYLAAFRVAEAEEVFPKGLPNQWVVVRAVNKKRCLVTDAMLP
jgi:hypothetical protein